MESAVVHRAYTNRAFCTFSPWNSSQYAYTIQMINLGNNPSSRIEIVSALNSFNLAFDQYHFNIQNCFQKYNPKVYLSTIQTFANQYIYDRQNGQTNGLPNLLPGDQKSGSWPQVFCVFNAYTRYN